MKRFLLLGTTALVLAGATPAVATARHANDLPEAPGAPIPDPNASCVGYGITTYAPYGYGDDVAHFIQAVADATGVPHGQITSAFARGLIPCPQPVVEGA